ncbi:LysR family transcriptional regulator [Eggerthellaceae bacterium zg-1084]|uniref:LysR family transcriptional regulator n=1 Tax=Berryella wangjianweii TaxID=2734634 RepID=UPI001551A87B|nr:LysR family transcriptional regulator [Berryella wangjianweii]NPD30459.1 LysR family transcriptional regulator [Berryella wangjianweii]
MDTRFIREFLDFATDLNYSAAARRLFITRPTLVDHIRELEAELHCQLVMRRNGRPALTPAGNRFVGTGTRYLADTERMLREYRELSDNLLNVKVSQTNLPWIETLLYESRHAIQSRHPEKRIEISTQPGACSSVDALVDGTNDLVVVGRKSYRGEGGLLPLAEGIEGFFLRTEEIKLMMTRDNPLFHRAAISARDLDGATLMLPPDIYQGYQDDDVPARFAERGALISLATARLHDHFEYSMLDFGSMFGVMPVTLASRLGIEGRTECRLFSLDDLRLETRFCVLYLSEFARSANGRLLIDEMARRVREGQAAQTAQTGR